MKYLIIGLALVAVSFTVYAKDTQNIDEKDSKPSIEEQKKINKAKAIEYKINRAIKREKFRLM